MDHDKECDGYNLKHLLWYRSTREVSERTDVHIRVVFCHEAITGPRKKTVSGKLYLYCSPIPPLHWNALGARRLPCKVSVWTAWHTTSSKWGIFLEVSSFICISFLLLRSFDHGLGNHNHKVFEVNSLNPFSAPAAGLIWHLLNSALTFGRRPPPLLSVFYNFTKWPFWHQIQIRRLLFTSSNILRWWKFYTSQARKYFFFFQKNTSASPPILFSLLSRVVYCFLTVSRSVAQNVFNASQGVRDIGFLSWTPLTIFPPQVSCMKEG